MRERKREGGRVGERDGGRKGSLLTREPKFQEDIDEIHCRNFIQLFRIFQQFIYIYG